MTEVAGERNEKQWTLYSPMDFSQSWQCSHYCSASNGYIDNYY